MHLSPDQEAPRHRPPGPADFGVERFSVPALLDRRAEQFGDRVLVEVDDTPISFEQMRQRSCAAASALLGWGIGRGDCVALFTATCPEWIYFWLGAARIGAVTAAVNAANKGEFLLHALDLARPKAIITDAQRRGRVEEVADDLAMTPSIVAQTDSLDDLFMSPSGRAVATDAAGAGEGASLFFTSGTTGVSKAVATSWPYLFTAAATVASAWEFRAGDVLWSAMPLFHLSAAATVLAPMLVGGTTILAAVFHPGEVRDRVRACGAVGFAGAGAMVSMLANQPADPRDAQLPLRFISAAPVDADLYRVIEKRYGCRVVTMYGSTEAFPITVQGVADPSVPGTSGRPNPNFEVRIVDGDGNQAPAGEPGEIICRARYPQVMSDGYVTAGPGAGLSVAPHPQWFHTGDLGALDADQNLTFLDRVKDSLRRRGENISSVEVERVVMQHPAVLETAAVGVPSELGEDDILLFVTLRPGSVLDRADLLDFCAARMPYFCVPRYVEIIEEIPKTVIGRIRKDVLRARGIRLETWDRERHGYVLDR